MKDNVFNTVNNNQYWIKVKCSNSIRDEVFTTINLDMAKLRNKGLENKGLENKGGMVYRGMRRKESIKKSLVCNMKHNVEHNGKGKTASY